MSIRATTIANKAAVQKPSTSNLLPINLSVNKIIKMVMIKETNPKVSQFKGKVNSLKIPATMALTKPITNPVTIAQPKPATCAPRTIYAANATTTPVMSKLIINFILYVFSKLFKKSAKDRVCGILLPFTDVFGRIVITEFFFVTMERKFDGAKSLYGAFYGKVVEVLILVSTIEFREPGRGINGT